MIRRRHVALTLFVALGLIAGCGGNSTTAKPDSASTQAGVGVPAPALLYPHRCRPSQIAIAESAQISPATGQNPISIALTNEGTEVCLLYGYPTVALLDASGKRLPFRISHSGDQMITSRRPVAVRLAPRQSAFFLLNKYRCDLGDVRAAKRLIVGLPGIRSSGRRSMPMPTYPVFAYCGKRDPGSIVTVSPIVTRLAGALANR